MESITNQRNSSLKACLWKGFTINAKDRQIIAFAKRNPRATSTYVISTVVTSIGKIISANSLRRWRTILADDFWQLMISARSL